jgi:hypothetical protein
LVRIRETSKVWGFELFELFGHEYGNSYSEYYTVKSLYDSSPTDRNYKPSSSVQFRFIFTDEIIEYTLEPEESIVTALAKIGGLFALLRVSIILNLWHQSLFESS